MRVMTRFLENQPWNFDISPSAYFQEQKNHLRCTSYEVEDIKRKIEQGNFSISFQNGDDKLLLALEMFDRGIETLDELYDLTLETPNLNLAFDKRYPQLYAQTTEPMDLSLVLRFAKPAGLIGFNEEPSLPFCFYKIPFEHFVEKHFPIPQRLFYVTSNLGVLERLEYYQEEFRKMNRNDFGVKTFRDLVQGILFGYPVADVLEQNTYFDKDVSLENWKKKRDYSHDLGLLCHVPRPQLWTAQWHQQVGIGGEEHLQEVYRKVLQVDGLV